MKELAKTYRPSEIEQKIYDDWMNKGYFHARVEENKKSYL